MPCACKLSYSFHLLLLLPARKLSYSVICRCSLDLQVREMQKTVRDGRTGHESMTIQRGMGEKVRQAVLCDSS